jgi:hypothetical protein
MPISVSVELEAAWFMVLMEAIVPFDADIAAAMDEMPVSVGDGAPLVVWDVNAKSLAMEEVDAAPVMVIEPVSIDELIVAVLDNIMCDAVMVLGLGYEMLLE